MEEVWKTIELYPRYDISSEGYVRNNQSGRILNPRGNNRVMISYGGNPHALYVNKLMGEYFGEDDEEWRVVPDYRQYEVSNKGQVRNRRTGRQLKTRIGPRGRVYVTISDDGYPLQRPVAYFLERAFGR